MAAAMLGRIIGMKKGDTRMPPRAVITPHCASMSGMPPIPLPRTTPSRSGGVSPRLSPASSRACSAAATANWLKRDIRRASLGFM